jgi:hypothetical protein
MACAGPLITPGGLKKKIAARPGVPLAPAVRRRFSITCLLLAWVCANGMVWNVVQVVAWARMFHQFSQVMPAGQALRLTFDGEAPCDLCKLSQAAQDAERKQLPQDAALGAGDKLLLACDSAAPVILLRPNFAWPGVVNDAGPRRFEPVPVPPPRA